MCNSIGKNVVLKEGVILGDNIIIEDNVYIDFNCIIRDNVHIKKGTTVAANCILGEYQQDFFRTRKQDKHVLIIGENSIIRSCTIIYGDTIIGKHFQTGHRVTIRENTKIGNDVSIGTLSDIQGNCNIGDYARIHSNVFVAPCTSIEKFVWIFPRVVLTNDPTPPSENWKGIIIKPFAVIAAGSVVLPGVIIESDTLIAAGAVVTKDVRKEEVVAGNPAKKIGNINSIKNKNTGEQVYPWRNTFKRGMPWEDSNYASWYKTLLMENNEKESF